MRRRGKTPLFVQRANYRQRRVRSAAKLIPFLGLLLWAIPLAWSSDSGDAAVGSWGVIYVFAVWLLLVVLAATIAWLLRPDPTGDAESNPGP